MDSRQTGTLRSNFLIHWTGRDINPDYRTLTDEQREQYVCRLRNTLREETNGLWMNRNEEVIHIQGMCELRYGDTPMTCFTEIRLSRTYEHTLHYGCLGLGFCRRFVMDLFGAPVHYVIGDNRDKVILTLSHIVNGLTRLKDARDAPVATIGLEETGSTYHVCLEDGHRALFDDVLNKLKSVILLLKPMSDNPGDYRNLDESEWRVLYYPGEQERINFLEDDSIPPAKITFEPVDLQIIVFPDNETRSMALSDPVIMTWFGEPPDLPIIVTVEECLNF